MKRILFFIAFVILVANSSTAQNARMAIGTHFNMGTAITEFGAGVKAQVYLTDNFRLEPSLDWMADSETSIYSMWSVNLSAQYLLNVTDKLNIYPYLGAAYSAWTDDDSIFDEDNPDYRVAPIAGAGVEYYFNKWLGIYGELEYQFNADYQQSLISLGVIARF